MLAACVAMVPACSDTEPTTASTPRLDPNPTPEQGAMIAAAIQHCVIPIHYEDRHGTIFFPNSRWGVTAAHAVDFIAEDQVFTINIDGADTGLRLSLAAPEGALEQGRDARLDWAVLRTQGDPGPFGGCDLKLAPDSGITPGDVMFPVGLLGADFATYGERGELRVFRLEASEPMPGATASEELIWMRWPFDTAPNGFSGGPVFVVLDGEPVIVGITVLAVFQGDEAWLIARRVNDEVIRFADEG